LILLGLLLSCGGSESSDILLAPLTVEAGEDREVVVGQPLEFSVSLAVARQARWYFGDGEHGDGASLSHSYANPGHYVVTLEVTSETGEQARDSLQVLAYRQAAGVAPVWSSPLARAGESLWVVVPEAGQLSHIEAGELLHQVAVCDRPRTVFEQGGTLAVTCEESAKLVFVDVGTSLVLEELTLPTGSRPYGVVGRDGQWWVSLEGLDSVVQIAGTEQLISEVGPSPRGIAIGPDGSVWVTRFRVGAEPALMRVGAAAVPLAWSEGPDSDTGHRGVPNLMEQLAISPDGGRAYLGAVLQNVERGVFLDGADLTHETTLRGLLSVIELGESPREVYQKQFDDQGRALALALSPRGDWLYVSHPGTGTIHLLDAYTRAISGSLLDVGRGVNAMRLSDDGQLLYVHAWLDRELRAYEVAAFEQNAGPLWVAATVSEEPLEPEVLRGKQLFYDSIDTRITKDGYLACAHCHPDGRDDGQVWDLSGRGEGLRNTISLEGRAGMAMGPLHWSANFDEVQDFEFQLRAHGRGTGLVDDALWPETGGPLEVNAAGLSDDLDALAAFVASLTKTPRSPHDGAGEGEEIFLAAGCALCHPAPLYTDSNLDDFIVHDIGTIQSSSGGRNGEALEGLDTPTLLGCWATAPYLHDGSAATVEEAITAHDGVELSPATLEALTAFVRSL
jgi:cytochrome c peroxidase